MIIFKKKSSVTESKVSKGFAVKDKLAQAAVFGEGKLFLMMRIFSVKYLEKTVGRLSESKVEGRGEEKLLPRMELKFERAVYKWYWTESLRNNDRTKKKKRGRKKKKGGGVLVVVLWWFKMGCGY